jgi:tetrahydromethanopterin S-methyltransferase subunit B
MADEILNTDPNREITLNLGTKGTAFALGMLTGVICGVVAVIVLMNYTRR